MSLEIKIDLESLFDSVKADINSMMEKTKIIAGMLKRPSLFLLGVLIILAIVPSVATLR